MQFRGNGKNKLKIMKMAIFYLDKHTYCCNYPHAVKEGFMQYRFKKGEVRREEVEKDCILFLLEGSFGLKYNGEHVALQAGDMLFVRRGSLCMAKFWEASRMIIAVFEKVKESCGKSALKHLNRVKVGSAEPVRLRICGKLRKFLEMQLSYLEDGINCMWFHEIKLKELFWILKFYYPQEELAAFLRPVIGNNPDFRQRVLENYRKVGGVEEFAVQCGMSLSAFKKKFMEEFDESVAKWMRRRLNERIVHLLSEKHSSIKEIAMELNFSSPAHFSRYCKNNLGCSPKEWRISYGKDLAGKENAECADLDGLWN